jgi:hypothetical protein
MARTLGRLPWAARPMRFRPIAPMLCGMRHTELLPAFCAAIAVEIAHLRWILLTQWKCRTCGDAHLHCECKPAWVRILL